MELIMLIKSRFLLPPLAIQSLHHFELLLPLVGIWLVLVLKPDQIFSKAPVRGQRILRRSLRPWLVFLVSQCPVRLLIEVDLVQPAALYVTDHLLHILYFIQLGGVLPLVYLLLVEFLLLKLSSVQLVDNPFEVIYLPRSLHLPEPPRMFASVVHNHSRLSSIQSIIESNIARVVHISRA